MGDTKIEWCDKSWNPTRGCSRVSEGCRFCYAERVATRFGTNDGPFTGYAKMTKSGPRWTGKVELIEDKLTDPLHWRKPQRIFVNSMSDLFHENLPDEAIDRVFAVMALCPQHTFQVLTKRPERMRQYFASDCLESRITAFQWGIIEDRVDPTDRRSDDIRATALDPDEDWPLPNVWLGVSCEDQRTADERIPLLLQTPAAVRFVSYEPALSAVNFENHFWMHPGLAVREIPRIDWVIVGGESGPGARPFHIDWARNAVAQCKEAGVARFVKQLGALPVIDAEENLFDWPAHVIRDVWNGGDKIKLRDHKGGDWSEWSPDLRVREFPEVRA